MRDFRVIAFACLGFFIGLGVLYFVDNGYFTRWEKIFPTPQNVSEYFSKVQGIGNPTTKITKPCDYSSPEFLLFSNPPKNIVDCFQISEAYPDGYGRFAYALDSTGNVWLWKKVSSLYDSLFSLCLPGLGLLVGVLIVLGEKRPNQEMNSK